MELSSKSYGTGSWFSGQPSAQIGLFEAPGANALEVERALCDKLDRLAERFPHGIDDEFAFTIGAYVQESIQSVFITMSVALALVVATVDLFP